MPRENNGASELRPEELYKKVEGLINSQCRDFTHKFPNRLNDQFEELQAEAAYLFVKALQIYDETRRSSFETFFYMVLETRFLNLLKKQNIRKQYLQGGGLSDSVEFKNEFGSDFPTIRPTNDMRLVEIMGSLKGAARKLACLLIQNGCSNFSRAKALARRNGFDDAIFSQSMAEIKMALYGPATVWQCQ